MKTLIPNSINTPEEVEMLFTELINNEEGFSPLVDPAELSFINASEAYKLEDILGQCWEVCNNAGIDIVGIFYRVKTVHFILN